MFNFFKKNHSEPPKQAEPAKPAESDRPSEPPKPKVTDSGSIPSDLKPYCEGAVKFALQFGKEFSYKYEDIKDMEDILEILHTDYKNKKLNDQAADRIAVSLGIYLGQVMLDNSLLQHGYSWNTQGKEPCLAKDQGTKMYPITKVFKRISNGSEDNIKSFYDVGVAIAEGRFPER